MAELMSESNLSVEHFRNVIDSETKNLNSMCDKWSKVLLDKSNNTTSKQGDVQDAILVDFSENGVEAKDKDGEGDKNHDDEEFLGAIRTTIGQAKLLMSQRFKQFSKLIDDCEFKKGPLPTRLDDLAGFWEMISFQVDDVRQKFKRLEETNNN